MALSRLHQRVRRTIHRHALCPPGTRVLVGLSGGSDSVALTLLLLDLSPSSGFHVAGAAHLNHGLRPTADRDEAFCRDLAGRLGLHFAAETQDVRSYAALQRLSLEDAGRRLRHEFLDRAAREVAADRIAVGHTQDDQAETFLLKLMRGAGSTGLGGVYPRRGAVIRPLLDVSRQDLQDYLAARGQTWMEDESNADLANPRNRVRHRVLPELDRAYGGPTRPAIARAADLVREDAQFLDDLAARRFDELVVASAGILEIDAAAFLQDPAPVRRRVLLRALRAVARPREVGLEHVDAVTAVMEGRCGGLDVPGGRVELRLGKLVLSPQGDTPK